MSSFFWPFPSSSRDDDEAFPLLSSPFTLKAPSHPRQRSHSIQRQIFLSDGTEVVLKKNSPLERFPCPLLSSPLSLSSVATPRNHQPPSSLGRELALPFPSSPFHSQPVSPSGNFHSPSKNLPPPQKDRAGSPRLVSFSQTLVSSFLSFRSSLSLLGPFPSLPSRLLFLSFSHTMPSSSSPPHPPAATPNEPTSSPSASSSSTSSFVDLILVSPSEWLPDWWPTNPPTPPPFNNNNNNNKPSFATPTRFSYLQQRTVGQDVGERKREPAFKARGLDLNTVGVGGGKWERRTGWVGRWVGSVGEMGVGLVSFLIIKGDAFFFVGNETRERLTFPFFLV